MDKQTWITTACAVSYHMPDQPFALGWCIAYLQEHQIEEPSREDIEVAVAAYRRRIGENQ